MVSTIESKGPKCNRQFQLLVYFIKIFQHNQLYDTLLATPCTHKLKAGIAYRLDYGTGWTTCWLYSFELCKYLHPLIAADVVDVWWKHF